MAFNPRGGSDDDQVLGDINVTPLVDVMLVLLIIMMIIAPLLQKGVDVRLPIAVNSASKPETQDQTVLGIKADRTVWLNGVEVRKEEMRQRLDAILETKKEKLILIKADEDAPYSAIMDAMDQLRASGIEDVGLITDSKASSALSQGGQ
jgi:biopolymer transport protein TolR